MTGTLLKAQNTINFPCFGVGPDGTDIKITNTWLSKLEYNSECSFHTDVVQSIMARVSTNAERFFS